MEWGDYTNPFRYNMFLPALKPFYYSLSIIIGESLNDLVANSEPIGYNLSPTQNIFGSGNFLKKVLESRTNRTTTQKHYRALGSPEVHRIVLICSLYHTALNTLTQLQLDMLTGKLLNVYLF